MPPKDYRSIPLAAWTSRKSVSLKQGQPFQKILNLRDHQSRAQWLMACVFVLLLVVTTFDTAHAWNAYNNTQFDVDFKVRNIPGNDDCSPWTTGDGVTIKAGENTTSEFRSNPAPNWSNSNCNPNGKRDEKIDFVMLGRQDNDASANDLSEKKGRFRCDLEGRAGGWMTVYEQPRKNFDDNGNIRPNIYCVSFYKDDNGKQLVIDRSDFFADAKPSNLDDMELGNRDIRFLITGDPQFWSDSGSTSNIGVNKTADNLLDQMFAKQQQSKKVRGIIISGDLTQDSKQGEWDYYLGSISSAETHIYEGLGNHDSVGGTIASNAIPLDIETYVGQKSRNTMPTKRQLKSGTSFPNYSWDWHDVHFVQLNLFPGDEPNDRGTDPQGEDIEPNNALTFLKDDLADNVGSTNRPIVLIHHYGFDAGFGQFWWSDTQRKKYWNAIKDYNVIAIFVGHAHLNNKDHDDDWYGGGVDFQQPTNGDNRPDGKNKIKVFNAAAARGADTPGSTGSTDCVSSNSNGPISTACNNGVYLDVTIDSCNKLTVERRDQDGKLVGSATDQQQTITFKTNPPGGGIYALGEVNKGACLDLPPVASCVPDLDMLEANQKQLFTTSSPTPQDSCVNQGFTIDDGTSVGSCIQSVKRIEVDSTKTVTLTCTTLQGSASCDTKVTVIDTTNPTIASCALPGGTHECGAALPNYFVPIVNDPTTGSPTGGNPLATDLCTNNLTVNCTPADGTILSTSDALVECEVTDPTGNTEVCNAVLNVVDTKKPKVDTVAPLWEFGCGNDTQNPANLIPPVVSDQCDANLTITNDAPTKLPEGQTLITWTITDDDNNSVITTSDAMINDFNKPALGFGGGDLNQNFECTDVLTPATVVAVVPPAFIDDCDDQLTLNSFGEQDSYSVGDYQIGWDATDNTGKNSGTVFVDVSVTDTTVPQLTTPPGNVTVQCSGGSAANTTVDLTTAAPIATDLCDASVSVSPMLPSFWKLGSNTVPWTVKDDSGNDITPFPRGIVTIEDTIAPTVVSGPGNPTVECSGGGPANTPVTLMPPVASDSCDSSPTIGNDAPATFTLGSTQVTWTISDLTGNQVSPKPTSTVLLQDTTAPIIQVPALDVLAACSGGPENTPITLVPPVASDSCDALLTVSSPPTTGYPLGSTPINWAIQDDSGNVTPDNSVVTITDTQVPAIQCPQDISVEPTSSTGTTVVYNATATDECRLVSVLCAQSGDTFPVGSTTAVGCEAVDLGGNRNTCTLNVTVLSEEQVAQTMQDTILVLADTGILNEKDEKKVSKDAQKILDRLADGEVNSACVKTEHILDHFVDGIADGTYTATEVDAIITSSTNLLATMECQK